MDDDLNGAIVRVFSTGSVTEGHLAKGRLESEGIPVMLKGEGEGPYRAGPVFLFVPAEFETQARLILDTIEAGGGDTEPLEGDFSRSDTEDL